MARKKQPLKKPEPRPIERVAVTVEVPLVFDLDLESATELEEDRKEGDTVYGAATLAAGEEVSVELGYKHIAEWFNDLSDDQRLEALLELVMTRQKWSSGSVERRADELLSMITVLVDEYRRITWMSPVMSAWLRDLVA